MRFLIADDHPIFRSGLKALLENVFPDAEITEVQDGAAAEIALLSEYFDVAILDIDMPEKNGLEVCSAIQQKALRTRIIILTMYKDAEMLSKAFGLGAHGYLVKDNTSDELLSCVEAILNGETYLAKALRKSEEVQERMREHQETIELLKTLTQSELKTLKLVSQKYASKEIAELLFVSPKSIENYRSRICKKLALDAKNNSLLIWVLEHKSLIDDL